MALSSRPTTSKTSGGGNGGGTGTITLNSLSEYFDQSLAILTDVLLHPSFPADELEKWKTRQRGAIERRPRSPRRSRAIC